MTPIAKTRLPLLTALPVVLIVAVCALAATAFSAGAASSGFGADNRVITTFPGLQAKAAGIVRDRGGLLLVAGTAAGPGGGDVALARYLPGGQLDPSFGNGGTALYDFGGDENVSDVELGSEGRIVVAGWSGSPFAPAAGQALIVRLLPDGGLDPTFGQGGVARPGPGGVQAVATDGRERVTAAGSFAAGPFDNPWQVWRLTDGGQLDSSFGGGDGLASGKVGTEGNSAEDLVLNVRGRITLAVCAQTAEVPNTFAVVRLRNDGSPDPTFGGGSGAVDVDFGDQAACPRALAMDRRNWIVAAGAGTRDMLVARLRWDGSLDSNFGGDGRARVRFPRFAARLGRVAVDANRRIVLAGQIEPSRSSGDRNRFALARLDRDGRPDPNFGRQGRVAARFGKAIDAGATSLALREGVVYAAGSVFVRGSGTPPPRFALFRHDGVAKRR